MDTTQLDQDFLADPKIMEHYSFLQDIGVFQYTHKLNQEIRNYKSLLTAAADIFNRTTINEIQDATVWQLSDQFQPSFIVFLWKPHQNKEDVTIKSYQNYKMVDMPVNIETIAPFEPFFRSHRGPIYYDNLAEMMEGSQYKDNAAIGKVMRALDELRPALVIPILGPVHLYGLILVGHKMLISDFTPSELNYIEQLMSFVSQAIQNNLHYQYSVRDVKTGLFNHGFFSTRLNEEIARTKRTGSNVSLIVIDVDKFKLFNDNYGHLAGDRVLEYLAFTIQQNVRAEDIPSRFGGEEFTILLPNADREAAFMVAERLRISVAEMKVPWELPLPRVTISLGLVTFDNTVDFSVDDIMALADKALYQSKENGRNRTTIWGQF